MNYKNNKGSVSMFVVIFATLLITVVTVGFIKIMVKDQQQASAADLSRSAYDSAQAGVEDAKRAIANYEVICGAVVNTPACEAAKLSINSSTCNVAVTSSLASAQSTDNEVKIQTGDPNSLNQAYTCVKIKLNTDDYIGVLGDDESKLIPLVGVEEFSSIKIEWFNQNDLKQGTTAVNVPDIGNSANLLKKSEWTTATAPNRPPVMRAQLIEVANNFNFNNLNDAANNVWDDTIFLYPSKKINTLNTFDLVSHGSPLAENPIEAECSEDISSGGFSCSAEILLRKSVAAGVKAFLNIKSIYKKSNYRVSLLNGAQLVKFNAVQPEIDSTGRANNLFRRVLSRLELSSIGFSTPQAAVDIDNSFCKVLLVTTNYYSPETGKCDPGSKS